MRVPHAHALACLRRRAPLGFTDHDRDLTFDATNFSAATGLEASELESKLGFAVGGGEVAGALVSASLTEVDLASGRWDGATLEIWRVDWSNPAARLLIDMGGIGEVRRSEFAFTAEVRSVAHELDEARGRLYQAGCAADLGDARCTVNLSASAFRANAIVVSTDGNLNFIADALNFDDAFFDGGLAAFTTGDNTGVRVMIKNHRPATAGASSGAAESTVFSNP